jgi:hypothetical protein
MKSCLTIIKAHRYEYSQKIMFNKEGQGSKYYILSPFNPNYLKIYNPLMSRTLKNPSDDILFIIKTKWSYAI